MSLVKIFFEGRLIKDPEERTTTNGKSITTFSVACDTGYGEYKSTLFFNCTAFAASGENIKKYFGKGDQIIIEGVPTQRKDKEGKVWHGVMVNGWSFGAKKKGDENSKGTTPQEEEDYNNPFSDDDIPF